MYVLLLGRSYLALLYLKIVCRIYALMVIAMIIITCACVQVLSIIQTPYSAEFGSVFLPLVQNQDISGPLVNVEATDLVSQFIGKCTLDLAPFMPFSS